MLRKSTPRAQAPSWPRTGTPGRKTRSGKRKHHGLTGSLTVKKSKERRQRSAALLQSFQHLEWWEITFVAIGFVALIGVIVILFLPIGKGPARFTHNRPLPPAGSPAFL